MLAAGGILSVPETREQLCRLENITRVSVSVLVSGMWAKFQFSAGCAFNLRVAVPEPGDFLSHRPPGTKFCQLMSEIASEYREGERKGLFNPREICFSATSLLLLQKMVM